nr:MAG TPA: hypothetical protein [Caudoviricetes sp.]
MGWRTDDYSHLPYSAHFIPYSTHQESILPNSAHAILPLIPPGHIQHNAIPSAHMFWGANLPRPSLQHTL